MEFGLAWWISIIGVPLVGAIFMADFYIHRNAQAEREKICREKDAEITVLHARVDAAETKTATVQREFWDYKVNASTLYATTVAVGEMRRELVVVVTRIEDKLDRLTERKS